MVRSGIVSTGALFAAIVSADLLALPAPALAQANSITGVVVNERREPLADVQVHAFPALTAIRDVQAGLTAPFSGRAASSTSTDSDGRFQLSGLDSSDYVVVAQTRSLIFGTSNPATIYATTFYPSTMDYRAASGIPARIDSAPIQIQMAAVPGVRVSGSVVTRSGRPAGGMAIRLFERLGGFGAERTVGTVSADGRFEIPRVPPGWYRLTIAAPPGRSASTSDEFATRLIEVRDRHIDLALVATTGASIAGRVVAEPGMGIESPVGLLISALPQTDYYGSSMTTASPVAFNWTFQMSGLSGPYEFFARSDRPPFVKAVRINVDGVERSVSHVEFDDGDHNVLLYVEPREPIPPAIDSSLSSAALLQQFRAERVFYRQFEIAQAIVQRGDSSVLPSLADWLDHEDRHVRGNTAFIFGGFGDARGLSTIAGILSDRSTRSEGQGIAAGAFRVERQIAADRYYAAVLLGRLRDSRAVSILVPLLKDNDVNYAVPSALAEIGDASAIAPLLDALGDDNPSIRVLAIYALETLDASEALPRLTALLDDRRRSNFGGQVSVADAARAAIAKLQN